MAALLLSGCVPEVDTGLYVCSSDHWCKLQQTALSGKALRRVWGLGGHDLWAVGDHGTALHWDGTRWEDRRADLFTAEDLAGVWASSPDDVWLVGKNATLLRSSGRNWSIIAKPTNKDLYGVSGSGPQDVWFVGAQGTVLHFDGTLQLVTIPTTNTLRAVWVRAGQGVYAVGQQQTIATYDYGQSSWSVRSDPLGGELMDVFGDGEHLYAAGESGTFVILDGMFRTRPVAGDLQGVWAASPQDIWLIGLGGSLYHDQGGDKPVPQNSGVSASLFSIYGFGPTEIWAVGTDGLVINYQP